MTTVTCNSKSSSQKMRERKKKAETHQLCFFFPPSVCDSEERRVRKKKKPSGCAKMPKTFRAILHRGGEISSSGDHEGSHSEFHTEQRLQNRSP